MGDACTGAATFTSFSTSTEQTFSVSQSTSRSLSVQDASTIDRTLTISGLEVVTQSIIPGATETVDVPVEVTVPVQRVVTVPILTLFAPCSTTDPPTSSSTPTSTPESTSTPVSSSRETTPAAESRTSTSNREASDSTQSSVPGSSSNRQDPTPTPTPSRSSNNNNDNNLSETGTIITTTTVGSTTLPNGSQSLYVATITTSIAPNGTLNDNNHAGGAGRGGSSRAVAIGVGVAGGIVALIILIMGITWHIRRKRRNALELDEDVWGPDHEPKTQGPRPAVIPEYTYNPYGEGRTTAYAPVPTMSPPRARPMSLSASSHTPHGSVSSAGAGGLVVPPILTRTKTADEILYEAAREDLPRSRTASSTTTRGYGSFTASSHMTHGGRSDSVVGLLESHSEARPDERGRLVDHENDRPASPVSIAAPKLAITNPDADKDP